MCYPFEVRFAMYSHVIVMVKAVVLQFLVCFNSCLLSCSYLHLATSLPYLLTNIVELCSRSSMVA
jgi:hypothetical protein